MPSTHQHSVNCKSTLSGHLPDVMQKKKGRRGNSSQEDNEQFYFNSFIECIMSLDRTLCMLDSKKKINNRLAVGNKDRIKDKGSTLSSINCISIHYKWKSEHSTSCGNQSIPPCVENKLSTSCGQKLSFPPCVGTLFCFTKLDKNNPIPIQLSKNLIAKLS